MKKANKRKKRLFWNLTLLNPKNLAREVHTYGYDFSWKSHILLVVCSLIAISAIGIVFELKPFYFSIVLLTVMSVLPLIVMTSYKRMYEQKRFADAVTYMEQMLYSFQKTSKIRAALEETRSLFDGGMMRAVIDQALEYLNKGIAETNAGVLREALQIVESRYKCIKLRTVHELLISGEQHGGDIDKSIQIVLTNLEIWKRQGYMLQTNKKNSHKDNVISIGVATAFCVVALYILEYMGTIFPNSKTEVLIFKVEIIQITSFVFILFMLFILLKSLRTLSTDWLQAEMVRKESLILSSYHTVMNYDEAKEKRKSIIFATPFFIGSSLAFLFYKKWIGIICLAVALFMLCQHRVGYNLAQKDVNEELYFMLPQWLMELALLLQNNNVQVALRKSAEEAPVILKEELNRLLDRLKKNPSSLKAYTDFCNNFDIPEASSCMKILHSMAETGSGDSYVQISNLIQRVNEMQDIADGIRNDSIAYRARIIFSYPVLGCTIKLLIDLSVGMLVMFSMLSNMGGG